MVAETYQYRFDDTVPMDGVWDSLLIAAMAAEGLHGATRVRLEARFAMDRQERSVEIEATNGVGRDLARIFTGLLERQFGAGGFTVETT